MIQNRPGFSIVLANTVGRLSIIWMCMISVLTVNAQTPKKPVLVLPQEQRTQKLSLPKVGDQAPDFTLLDFKGRRFILSEQKSRKAVLLWFTNLCEGCLSKLPAMENLKTIFEKKGADFIAVSQLAKDRKTVEDVIQSCKLTLRFLYDPDGKATERYSGSYVPGTCPLQNIFVIQKNGTITYASHFPGVEQSELHELLGKVVERR